MKQNSGRRGRSWLAIIAVLALIGVGTAVWFANQPARKPAHVRSHGSPVTTADGNASTKPRNTAPETKYVGDEACRQCHAAEFDAYRAHPMGQSMAVARVEPGDPGIPGTFDSRRIRYRIEAENDSPIHIETILDEMGNALVEQRERVHFVVGSGTQGRSYLINRGGHLFLSPVTWYPGKQTWDLSPGYEKNNQHFDRPIIPECLFCHANHAHVDEEGRNHYLSEDFRGYAIGCERCHGPGELHVAHHSGKNSAGTEDAIVNPARLSPKLREAVCEQCHLSGVVRVVRRGKSTFDFRPGLPLEQYWSVFVKSRPRDDDGAFLGHVEQMHASRCFRESNGKLGCISCHDPHRKPAAETSASFYRERCLKCHEPQACAAPSADRQSTQPADDCVACHMPRRKTEVRHTASTDHRVLRRAGEPGKVRTEPGDPVDAASLTHFHRRAWGKLPISDREIDRDLGIGLLMAMDLAPDAVDNEDARLAGGLLRLALAEHPEDVAAQDAFALSRYIGDDSPAALKVLAELVKAHPNREVAWEHAAIISQSVGHHGDSVRLWQRAMELNPGTVEYPLRMAISLANLHRWDEAAAAARRALELQPANPGARQVLIESLLGLDKKQEAEQEFQLLQKLDPARADARREWYEKHPLR